MKLITKQSPKTEYDRIIKEVEAKRKWTDTKNTTKCWGTGINSKIDRLLERLTKWKQRKISED